MIALDLWWVTSDSPDGLVHDDSLWEVGGRDLNPFDTSHLLARKPPPKPIATGS